AQCHDHKYDPLTQRDYYQFCAFFNSDVEVDVPAPLPGEMEPYRRKKAAFDGKTAELEAAVAAYKKEQLPTAQQKWEKELPEAERGKLPANVAAILQTEPDHRDDKQKQELADYYAKLDRKLAELTKAVAEHKKAAPALSMAQTLAIGPVRKTHVLI